MIDEQTLNLIKKNQFDEGVNFPEEMHRIINEFYNGFDLDRNDPKYRESYILSFIEQHEKFLVNYVTNVYRANLKNTDELSDNLTFNKFLDTIAIYLIKCYDENGQTTAGFKKEEYKKNG